MKRIALFVTVFVFHTMALAEESVTVLKDFGFLIERMQKNAGELFVIDARERKSYLSGTVPGAVHAGPTPDGYAGDGQGGPVLVLTEGDVSIQFLEKWNDRLKNFGHEPIYFLQGGFESWLRFGGPVEQPAGDFVVPGTVPFVIPRGLCELNTPAKSYP